MTTAEATSGVASWIQWLEAATGRQNSELVLGALREVERKRDSLSARLAFGKLSLHVRAIPLERGPLLPGPALPEASLPGAHLPGASLPEPSAVDVPEYLVQDIATRVTFLVGLAELLLPSDLADVITTLYRTGSEREQISVLRALPFFPGGPGLVALAREASRTNDVTVFSALACDNRFPAACLPDPAFEQLVLKALFLGVPIPRILDVETRVTSNLLRMIGDFAAERRAAGRTVPSDVPWLLTLSPQAAKLI